MIHSSLTPKQEIKLNCVFISESSLEMKKSRPQNLSIEGPGSGLEVVVGAACLRAVAVAKVVVVPTGFAEFDEQFASTTGSATTITPVSNFVSELIYKFLFNQHNFLISPGTGTTRGCLWSPTLTVSENSKEFLGRRVNYSNRWLNNETSDDRGSIIGVYRQCSVPPCLHDLVPLNSLLWVRNPSTTVCGKCCFRDVSIFAVGCHSLDKVRLLARQ